MGSNLTLHKYTNRFYEIHQTKNEEKPASGQNKVRADIFSGSLAVCLSASASRRGGREGGLRGIPPAEPIGRKISSDFFKYTPPKLKIGIGSRNGVAPQARHKRIPAKNSRIQKGFPRSACGKTLEEIYRK